MMTYLRSKWLMAIALSTLVTGLEPARATEWLNFRAGGLVANQQLEGTAQSGELAWSPFLKLGSNFSLRPEVGVSILPDPWGGRFAVADLGLSLGIRVFKPWLELGPGIQSWFSSPSGTFVSLNTKLVMPVKLAFVREVFAGYTRVFLTGNGVTVYRFGVGVPL